MMIRSCMSRWLVAAMMACGLNGAARAEQIPTDEPAFTAFVAGRIRAEIRDIPVVVKGPLTVSIGPLQANLDRIYAFCKANAAGCAGQITNYVGDQGLVARRRTPG